MEPVADDRRDRAPRVGEPAARASTTGALAGLAALEHQQSRPPATLSTTVPTPAAPRPVAPPGVGVPPPVPASVRRRVRTRGPFVALLLPAVLGVAALVMLRDSTTVGTGVPGFVLALLAAPLLPAFGAPLSTGSIVVPVAASALLWFVLGAFASQRATRSGAGGWGRFWSEYAWLTSCVWVGAILAVVTANLVLGRVLL